jgi:hypothetical protein
MANNFAPFGLRPLSSESGETRVNYYTVSSASTQIYEGDVVELSSGLVIKSTGTLAVTALGVAAKQSGTITGTFSLPVYDDPGTIFAIMANASAAVANIGTKLPLVQGTATNYNGVSVETLSVVANSSSYPLQLVGFDTTPGNDTSSSNMVCLVKINTHVYGA